MGRGRKKGKETKPKTYSFTIDELDPKYTKLIEFLDNIDVGVRSYTIRQILNSYIGNQTPNGTIPLIQSVNKIDNETNTTATSTPSMLNLKEENQAITQTPQQIEQPKEKKKIKALEGLKNQFGVGESN